MNTYTLCFCPLIRNLQAFEILKWAQGSQWRSRGHPISPVKYNLYFHCSENTTFYIFTAVKYSFFKIYIIFNQYFSVFHYFVYNEILQEPSYGTNVISSIHFNVKHGIYFRKVATVHFRLKKPHFHYVLMFNL